MNTILFHQNVSYKVSDIFVIDGVKSESIGSAQQQKALQILEDRHYKLKKIWIPYDFQQKCSNVLELYFGISDICIISQSQTLDEVGRLITFTYYSSSYADAEATMNTLRESIRKAGLEPNEGDMQVIKWAIDIVPKEKKLQLLPLLYVLPLFYLHY